MQSNREQNSECLELFFNTFIDEDLNDEINLLQWIQSLKTLSFGKNLSERDMMDIFYYIDCDSTGFMDSVDFVNYCTSQSIQQHENKHIATLYMTLIKCIQSHPFFIS